MGQMSCTAPVLGPDWTPHVRIGPGMALTSLCVPRLGPGTLCCLCPAVRAGIGVPYHLRAAVQARIGPQGAPLPPSSPKAWDQALGCYTTSTRPYTPGSGPQHPTPTLSSPMLPPSPTPTPGLGSSTPYHPCLAWCAGIGSVGWMTWHQGMDLSLRPGAEHLCSRQSNSLPSTT